ncbi:hypothetical protein ACTFIR_012844 [Dictyostelium discoideum]
MLLITLEYMGEYRTYIHISQSYGTHIVVDKSSKKVICTSYSNGRQHDFRLYEESKVRIHPVIHVLTDSSYQGLQKLHFNTKMPNKKSKKILSHKKKRKKSDLIEQ